MYIIVSIIRLDIYFVSLLDKAFIVKIIFFLSAPFIFIIKSQIVDSYPLHDKIEHSRFDLSSFIQGIMIIFWEQPNWS